MEQNERFPKSLMVRFESRRDIEEKKRRAKILEGFIKIAKKERVNMTSVVLNLLEQGIKNYNSQDQAFMMLDSSTAVADRFSKLRDALYDILVTGRMEVKEKNDTILKQFQLLSLTPSLKDKSINVFQIQSGAVYQMTVKVVECLKLLDGVKNVNNL